MSIVICEHCDNQIDSDVDLYCFVTDPFGNAETICSNCQERAYDRQQERLMEDGGGPSLIEQQRAAYNIKHGIRS